MSPNYNVQHRNDGQLLPIKAPQPFSESHWWHIMLISGLGPALEAIYNTLMQRSQIQYFYSLKALLHSLTNLSVGAPTSTNPLHSSELKRITTRHRSTLIKVRSSASSVGIGPAHARGSRSFSPLASTGGQCSDPTSSPLFERLSVLELTHHNFDLCKKYVSMI
jgi:hypothetical protein